MPSNYGEGKEPLSAISEPTVIFVINNSWKITDTEEAIYNATHAAWKISESVRERAVYALGVANGVVRGAYRIDDWFEDPNQTGRWIFRGVPAVELDAVDKSVARLKPPQGQQTAVRPYMDGIPAD
ncbi:MAG: hypothetical protein H0V37_14035 [Chloroflexia bacterium]|nr:hypothetical protein [Chloroflexia bacterium]